MKKITKEDWERVTEKACDIANAVLADDDILSGVYREQLMVLSDELEGKYGELAVLYDTRGDFTEDYFTAMAFHRKALDLAEQEGDRALIEEVKQSIENLKKG